MRFKCKTFLQVLYSKFNSLINDIQNRKKVIVWILVLVFAISLVIQFIDTVSGNENITYIFILLVIGSIYKLRQGLNTYNRTYHIAFSIMLAGVLLIGRVSGAVGIIGSENQYVNLIYWVIPLIGLSGFIISYLKPHGMALTSFTMALVQFFIPVLALIISPELNRGNAGIIGVFVINSIFALLFVTSALLFQHSKTTKI